MIIITMVINLVKEGARWGPDGPKENFFLSRYGRAGRSKWTDLHLAQRVGFFSAIDVQL